MKSVILALLFGCMFLVQNGLSQVTAVKYQIRYNTTSCRYDAYMIVTGGSATSSTHRAQFNAQYSIIVPTGTAITVAQNFMPLQNNQNYTGTQPLIWQKSSTVIAPAVTPNRDYISITPTLSPTSFYNNLVTGDSVRLFSLSISPVVQCGDSIRIFENGVDPASDADGMGGGDFSNGFTIGGVGQKYTGNVAKLNPPKPALTANTGCSLGIEIDLTGTTSSCQSPLSYSWSGPNGYTSTSEDVNINPASQVNNGLYQVTVTDARGCSSTLNRTVVSKPLAGADQQRCAGGSATLTGTNPTTGTWTALGTNPAGGTLGSTTNGEATANFNLTASGIFRYIYTSGFCSDTMDVNVILPDAGPDPANVSCFSSGIATMAGVGTGTWTVGPGSAGTANITSPNSPMSTVTGFSVAGKYFMVWTVGNCTDIAEITVGDNCSCTITNNSLSPLSPNMFCETSGANNLIGATASPTGGNYLWQYKLNGGAYSNASGTNNLQNYTTPSQGIGMHSYRRIYTTTGSPSCSDTSNVVIFNVNSNPAAPASLTATPNPICLGNTVNLSVTNNAGATYTWTASATTAGLVSSTTSNTTMTPLAFGTYTISVTQTENGCNSVPSTVSVVVNNTPITPTAGTVTSTNPTSCGTPTGSISLSGYLPSTAFTVTYLKNSIPVSVNLTSNASGIIIIPNLTSGSYTNFKVTNAANCQSGVYAGPVTLTDPSAPAPPSNIAASPNPTCSGSTVALSVTNNPGATYAWSASSTNAGLVASSTNSTTMVANASGFYTISVTQTVAGCTSDPSTLGISINSNPPTPNSGTVSSTNPTTCGGTNGTISLSGYMTLTAYTVTYSKVGSPITVNITSNGSGVIIITGLTTGSYSNLSVKNITDCTSGVYAGPVILSDPSGPPIPTGMVATPNPVCLGNSVALSVTNTVGASYLWSASSTSAGLTASSTNSTTALATAAGTYTISVTQTIAGCTSGAASITFTVNSTPPTLTAGNITSSNPTTCSGTNGSITFMGLAASTTYSLQYSRNGTQVTVNITTNVSGVAQISGLSAGSYTNFRLTNAVGCNSGVYAGPVNLTDPNQPPVPSGISALPNPACVGVSVNLSVTNNASAIYVWSANSTNAGLIASATNSTTMLSNVSGSYVISVTQNVAGCVSLPATVTVNVNNAPPTPTAGTLSSTNPSACGGNDGTISLNGLTPSANFTFEYTKNGVPFSVNLNSNASGVITISNQSPGSYTGFKVVNALGCASGVYNGTISISDPGSPPAPSNLAGIPNPVCLGTTVNLSVTNNAGATYSWSASPSNSGLVASSTNTTSMLATVAGSYTISVAQTIAGCMSPSASMVVIVNPMPPTLTNGNFSSTNPTTCNGSNGTIVLSGLPANTSYTLNYKKNTVPVTLPITTNGSGTATVTGLTAGSYTDFSLTAGGGCQSNVFPGPINLIDPSGPQAPAGLTAIPNPVCLGTTVNLSVTNNAGATYVWSASSTQAGLVASTTNSTTMNALSSGAFMISVTQTVGGCTSPVTSIVVNVNPVPPTPSSASVTSTNPTICLGTDGTISLSGLPVSASFTIDYAKNGNPVSVNLTSNGSGIVVINNLSAGTYTNFKITNAQTCSSGVYAGPVTLTDPNLPGGPTNLVANPNPACLGTTISLSVTNSVNTTFNWSSSSPNAGLNASSTNTTSMVPLSAGTYTISVTQTVAGCTSVPSTVSVVINQNPPTPNPNTISSVNPTCDFSNGSISLSGLSTNSTFTITYLKNGTPVSETKVTNSNGILTITGLSAGTYSDFRLTNSLLCSSGVYNGPVVLTSPGLPSAPVGISSFPDNICVKNMVTISVTNNPSATYTWATSGIGAGLIQSNTNTASLLPFLSGDYVISVTQTVNGCISPAASINILVRADCYNPDFGVTYTNVNLDGDLSTNDNANVTKQYDNPIAIAGNPDNCNPVLNFNGKYTFVCGTPGVFNFMVSVCDMSSQPECTKVPLQITVLNSLVANNPPIANHDYARTKQNTSVIINLRSNDKCQSASNCTIDAPTIVIAPINGSYNVSNSTYTPNNNFFGRDSLRYRICQTPTVTPANCAEAWVYVTVINDVITNVTNGMDDYNQTPLNTVLNVNNSNGLLANDTDPEGHLQSITPGAITIAGRGSLMLFTNGSYTFTPFLNYVGPVECEYLVCDNALITACDKATLHILVEPSNPTGSIGNFVWHDLNGDGVQNNGEPGIPGVQVRLFRIPSTLVALTTTNSLGEYIFQNVVSGSYYISVAAPTNFNFTFPRIGDPTKDSDIDGSYGVGTSGLINLVGGNINMTIDAGLNICSKIGDRVWYDLDKDDVWDTNENGINGLKINLWRNHFGIWTIYDFKYTGTKPGSPSDDGYYQFCVPPGQYYIQVIMPPLGLVQALPNKGSNPMIDSDLTNAFGPGTTNSFVLNSGQNKLDIGAGFYPMAVAGNLVWFDANMNGIQDSYESNVPGVAIKAYDAQSHVLVAESVTNIDGAYEMDYLQKKDIYLKFEVPAGYTPTYTRVTSDDLDSDVDHTYGQNTTRMFSMEPGVTNMNIDLGLAFGILPVDWLDVNVVRQNKNHLISWSTARESNVSHYEIERRLKTDPEFKFIGTKVNAKGNSNQVNNYNGIDSDVKESGMYLYRVKQIDLDGQFSYSKIVSISNLGESNINLYPIPAINESNLEINLDKESEIKIELYDSASKLVQVISNIKTIDQGQHLFKINLESISSGVYEVIVTIDGQKLNKKLIKIN